MNINIIDYLDIFQQRNFHNFNNNISSTNQSKQQQQQYKTSIIKVQNNDSFPLQQQQFDLIISGLQLNHTNNQSTLLQKYLRTLKPDGALLGCIMSQGTLSELHWSYLMAQNQRYGGLSPKIGNFMSLGQLGNILTSSHYHLVTVLNRDYQLEFDSVLDLLKTIQYIGESNYLKGRRKGVYKDLLISMYALYQAQFSYHNNNIGIRNEKENIKQKRNENNNQQNNRQKEYKQQQQKDNSIQQNKNKQQRIYSSLVLAPFLGWKYSQNQPKALRRGQHHGQSIQFIDQLRKYDPDLQHYKISQDRQQPEQIKQKKQKK